MREAPASEGLLGAANFAASELTAEPVQGTSTLLLGHLDPNGALDLLNYGDSGAIKEANELFVFENEYFFLTTFDILFAISEISGNVAQDLSIFCLKFWIYCCMF